MCYKLEHRKPPFSKSGIEHSGNRLTGQDDGLEALRVRATNKSRYFLYVYIYIFFNYWLLNLMFMFIFIFFFSISRCSGMFRDVSGVVPTYLAYALYFSV